MVRASARYTRSFAINTGPADEDADRVLNETGPVVKVGDVDGGRVFGAYHGPATSASISPMACWNTASNSWVLLPK